MSERISGNTERESAIKREGQETLKLSIVFVDDGEGNAAMFRSQFGGRGFTYRGNPYLDISPQQRLVEELQKAQLIPKN